jgi:hypothetical protein
MASTICFACWMPKTRDESDDEYEYESDEIDDDDDEFVHTHTHTQTYLHTTYTYIHRHIHTYMQYACTAVNFLAVLLFVQSTCRKHDFNTELLLWAA